MNEEYGDNNQNTGEQIESEIDTNMVSSPEPTIEEKNIENIEEIEEEQVLPQQELTDEQKEDIDKKLSGEKETTGYSTFDTKTLIIVSICLVILYGLYIFFKYIK